MLARVAAVAIVLLVGTFACAPRAVDSPDSTSPEAQATSVRRTAVAEVQRIIAGNLSATPTPAPSATPAPQCAGAIWWHEARSHLGETRAVQGAVVAARPGPNAATMLELGQV